ncbi:TIGR03759 family integrating conjugative element protein [Pseudomonas kunmingensis]|uniref:TIGR03759 family integrating conjugative element protein n=1 Tax=Stutzerimonas kunmingensis TaxID=1211807 RepID=UPI0017478844|nr:TIGR03759 family integrating conjugative element protein [Stutzerimonas kunmingensis]MBD3877987.1 TIGR03759 family integrating conjugative element protein [Stutzerimonas kunmingensis]
MRFVRILPLLLALTSTVHADGSSSTMVDSQIRNTELARTAEEKAAEWGLTAEDWKRYQELMDGPRGIYSPGLDPVSVLGIEARTDEERMHYARIQAQMETQRMQKELLYQRAYDEAVGVVVQGQQVVNLKPEKPMFSSSEARLPASGGSGRLALFVASDCAPCVQKAIALQRSNTPFDIYVVGSEGDDSKVRSWARSAGIEPERVRSRQITLNHDEGRWAELQESSDAKLGADLPLALRFANGKWVLQ